MYFCYTLTAFWMVSEILLYQSINADIDPQCMVNCSCCKNQICGSGPHFVNGSCKTGCIDGYRGDRCYEQCTFNCKRCAGSTDRCSNCFNGYHPGPKFDCTSKCSPGCETCSSEKVCTKCKIYNYNAGNSTDCPYTHCTHNCECQNKTCVSCKDGFYDITTLCSKSCPENCGSCTSEETCGKCKDGYFNGYAFDNTSLSHLWNCSHECRDSCTQCTSYDTCTKCVPGRYGAICNEICSAGCTSNECLKESGQCTCALNFIGNTCVNCKAGAFGNMCEKSCSSGCKENICDKQSGNCLDGCIVDSVIGKTCNACLVGKYGDSCDVPCPTNCNGNKCSRENGTCIQCKANYAGTFCQSCENGKYGAECNLICPDRCEGSACEKDSGKCLGCSGNFIGDRCAVCKRGFFGPQCSDKCSEDCFDYICDRNTGVCLEGCKRYFYGDKCCSKNPNCIKCLTNEKCEECKIGFYGSMCNMTCSKYCVDSLCSPETGVCTRGCNGTFDKYVCSLEAESEAATSEASNQNVVAVIGTFLAISLVVNITVGSVVIVRKILSCRREQTHATEVVSETDTTAMTGHVNLPIHNERASDLECTDTTEYEQLELGQAQGMAAENSTEYYNVNIEND